MTNLAPHETLELHELLCSDSSEVKKLTAIVSNLRDEDLKNFIENYLDFKKDNIQAVGKLIDTIKQQP
ncbi:MAG: hypothetical protein H7Y18_18690 [Clostridiaceae bacterium]|nr:hypothetical protein [Clostridiaceae bacterium]